MKKIAVVVGALLWAVGCGAQAQSQGSDVSGERIRAHVKFLASDLLEGRAPGTRGGDLAQDYIAAQFALAREAFGAWADEEQADDTTTLWPRAPNSIEICETAALSIKRGMDSG